MTEIERIKELIYFSDLSLPERDRLAKAIEQFIKKRYIRKPKKETHGSC